MKISIVIPAYNEVKTIAGVLNDIKGNFKDQDYEIIVVDDGSYDHTAEAVKEAQGARLVTNNRNRGYGFSIKRGIKEASGELIITMDADGQHKAKEAKRMLGEAGLNDMVVGARRLKDSISLRTPGKWFLRKISEYLVGHNIPDINSGLKIFKKEEMRKYLHLCSSGFSFSTTSVLSYISDGLEVKFIEIESAHRQGGRSRVNLKDGFRSMILILQIIMVFNPLKIFFTIFFIILFLACGFIVFDFINSGQISDTSSLLVITALLVFLFGLISDQIAKIRKELVK